MFNFLSKKKLAKQAGVTILELMMVIAVMAILSAGFYVGTVQSKKEKLKDATEKLTANLKVIRNLASAKAVYKFSGQENASFPAGGYGLDIDNSGSQLTYVIYADNGSGDGYSSIQDEIIVGPEVLDADIDLVDSASHNHNGFFMAMTSDRDVVTDMVANAENKYEITLRWAGTGYPNNGLDADLVMGELNNDGSFVSNVGYIYSDYVPTPPAPPANCGGKCGWQEFEP